MEQVSDIKILVVDDHQENLMALAAVLADDQYGVVTVTSGLEALRRLLVDDFAVILLDVQMPDMDGFETAKLIRERARSSHTPIVFLTAINTDRAHVARGYSLGAVDYLFKPFDPEILKAKVASFVELARKTQELEAEVRRREQVEDEVRALNLELEDRVLRRTAALRSANRDLRSEITERRRAEAEREQLFHALTASEERYRALAEAMPQLVWTADGLGEVDYVNRRWVEYSGLPEPESLGEGWIEALHPDDAGPTLESWRRAVGAGEIFEVACRCRRESDGMYRWHLARALPVRSVDGKARRWMGTLTDIEDQKRFEDSLQFLAEASRVLGQTLEYELSLVQVARLAVPWIADWCLVDVKEGDAIKRLAVAHIDPERESHVWDMWEARATVTRGLGPAEAFRTGEAVLAHDITPALLSEVMGKVDRESQEALGIRSCLSVPVFAHGCVMGVFTFLAAESRRQFRPQDVEVVNDLARRVGFAVDNARLFREVQEAGLAKDRFLAMLGHELRNPLAPIRNAVAAMRARGLNDPAQEKHREIIERQAGHLSRLVDDLLDVARITQGKIELRKIAVDFVAVVQEAVETARPAAAERAHRIQMQLPNELICVEVDPTRLEQILANLLNNAVRYTTPGGQISLEVSRERRAEQEMAVLRVRDTGVGISAQVLHSIFEPFTQADRSPDRSQGGLGLGLTVVRRLVELHGGTVQARSGGAGQGSEFEVTLPVSTAEIEGACPHRRPETPHRGTPLARVLVVDDNRDAAETLTELLLHWGYEVESTGDGESALALAERFHPDLVLLDIGLPGMDGYTVAECLRKRSLNGRADASPSSLVLVAVTGYGQADDRRRAREAGFDHHLAKPVDPESLRDLLRREMSRIRSDSSPAAVR
jgi:PAS domain S-box-containing protein